jgi:hypothetical protein
VPTSSAQRTVKASPSDVAGKYRPPAFVRQTRNHGFKKTTAFLTFAIVLSVTATGTLAASEADDNETRSSIEWLIDDIGSVLKKIATTADGDTSQEQQSNDAAPPLATTTIEAATEKDQINAPTKPRGLVNPFSAMFADLVTLLKGQGTATPSTTPEDVPPSTLADASSLSTDNPASAHSVPDERPADPAQAVTEGKHSNPISWLLSDLASLFRVGDATPMADKRETQVERNASESDYLSRSVETEILTEHGPAVEALSTDVAVESEAAPGLPVLAVEPANPLMTFFAALADTFRPATENNAIKLADVSNAAVSPERSAPQVAVQTNDDSNSENTSGFSDDVLVVEGPWTRSAEQNPFDPLTRVVTSDVRVSAPSDIKGEVSISRIPASRSDPDVATIDSAAQSPVRKRSEPIHEARNHRSLGSIHRESDETPREESLIANFVDAMFGEDDEAETVSKKIPDRIVAEERLDLGYVRHNPTTSTPAPEKTLIGESILTEIDLFLGKDTAIGSPYDPNKYSRQSCIDRPLHASVFCLTPLNWPGSIEASFEQDTAFFKAGEGVARYENGQLSRLYTIFNAADFAEVVKFMQRRFGAPMEREIIWMHMMEAPELPNTTFRWKAVTADRRDVIVLEVRNYDDMRRSFANTEHGMIRLYREGSRPIFKHLTTMDLMLMQRRRISRAPVEVNAPPPQR